MTVALAWLARPLSVIGLALLLVNDHLLKGLWPGVLTGKLSDVAGMLMFPPLLGTLLAVCVPRLRPRRLAIAALSVTGLAFTALKLLPPVAAAASDGLTGVVGPALIRPDPTDLIALPALYLCWRSFVRAAARPVSEGKARVARAMVLVPIGLLATMATSTTIEQPPSTLAVSRWENMLWLTEADVKNSQGLVYLSSEDGGHTLRKQEFAPEGEPRVRDCAGQVCYRVVEGELHVQHSPDGGATWATVWRVSGGQYSDLAAEYGLANPSPELASRSLVVLATPNGHVVLVANGRDGLLRRDESGRWERLGTTSWGERVTLSQGVLAGGATPFAVAAVLAVMLFAALTGMGISALAGAPDSRWLLLTCAMALVSTALSVSIVNRGESVPAVVTLLGAALALTTVGLAGLVIVRYLRLGSISWPWIGFVGALAAATAWLVESVRARPDSDFVSGSLQLGLMALITFAGFVLSMIFGTALAREVNRGPRPAVEPRKTVEPGSRPD